jgi:pyridoxamine 5'-phosphate oxidase
MPQQAHHDIFDADGAAYDPFAVFGTWLEEATAKDGFDATAFALATADKNGLPAVRMVLLKSFDKDGFVFYTNTLSRKGGELSENPQAALCFHWKNPGRQFRARGAVTPVSAAEADEYFASRPYGSRIASAASDQSAALAARQDYLDKIAALKQQYPKDAPVPRPPHWSGYRIAPLQIEFWEEGKYRAHQRRLFTRNDPASTTWQSTLLYP